jgi:hypothetical protein
MSPGGREASDIELLLDCHRQAEQRALLAARQGGVGSIGGYPSAVEIADDDRIDLRVERLDARYRAIDQLARGQLPTGDRLHQITGRAVGEFF